MKKLKEKRQEKDLTQDDLARLSGCTVVMISAIERGVRRPSVELAKKLAEILDVDWTIFFS